MNDDHVMRMSSSPPAPLSLRLGVVLLIAVAMVGATQLTSRAQTRLDAPFCIMWAHAAMMVVCLPAAAALPPRRPTQTAISIVCSEQISECQDERRQLREWQKQPHEGADGASTSKGRGRGRGR